MSNRTTPRTRPMLSVSVESSLVAGDTEDIVKQAENILDDDTLLDISLNISAEVKDLMRLSEDSLFVDGGVIRLAASGDTRGGGDKHGQTREQKRRELREWQKRHQAEVREKYRKELETAHRPESRPFNAAKHVTTSDLKKTNVVNKRRREEMVVENHFRRQEQANQIYKEIKTENDELNLNMDNIYDVTVQVPMKKATKKLKTAPAKKRTTLKPSVVRRGRATIQTPTTTKPYSAPAGFRTTEPAAYNRYDPTADTGVSGYGFTPRYTATAASANYDDAENEAPMEDESYLLVPRYKGGQDESERIRQLLYSDQTLERVGSEMNLSNISDLITESELSAESYLDWDVIDEMVAILSTHSS